MAHQVLQRGAGRGLQAEAAVAEPKREIPEPSYQWPGGPTADDDPTPVESALAALKLGAILAAAMTIVFFYLATYGGVAIGRRGASLAVIAAFVLPSVIAFLRTLSVRRRRAPGKPAP